MGFKTFLLLSRKINQQNYNKKKKYRCIGFYGSEDERKFLKGLKTVSGLISLSPTGLSSSFVAMF